MTETTSCRSPRLEPDVRLSPHPAQHPEIVLSLCSVTIGADNLAIAYVVCILGIFEPGAGYDVITMNLSGMARDSLTIAIGAIACAPGPFERDGFIPIVHPSLIGFMTAPSPFIHEKFLAFD